MMLALGTYLAGEDLADELRALIRWASFVLTLPIVAFSAQPFLRGALDGLTMNLPIAIAIVAGFSVSVWTLMVGTGDV